MAIDQPTTVSVPGTASTPPFTMTTSGSGPGFLILPPQQVIGQLPQTNNTSNTQNSNLPDLGDVNNPYGGGASQSSDPDVLKYLIELKYAGIAFPAVSFTENGSQDLAIHKYPNLDSGRVEQTGRNPSIYSCRGIFTNNIYPSQKESWVAGTLFPTQFETILSFLMDATTFRQLQHPFLGIRNVVPQHWSYSFIGKGPRDGVYLDMTFVETIGDASITDTITSPSSLADMQTTGGNLDTAFQQTELQPMNPPNLTLGQFFSKIAGIVQNISSFPQQVIAPINAQVVQVNSSLQGAVATLGRSPAQLIQTGNDIVNQNKGLISNGPVSNAYYYDKASLTPIFNFSQQALNNVYSAVTALNNNSSNTAIQLLKNTIAFLTSLISYYQSLNRVETSNIVLLLNQFLHQSQNVLIKLFNNNRNYKVMTYVTKSNTTIFALAKNFNNTVDQLNQLNPNLNKFYIIPDGTQIQYYQA